MTSTNAFKIGSKFFLTIFSFFCLSVSSIAQTPCTFNTDFVSSSVMPAHPGQNDGSFILHVLDGVGPYTYTIVDLNHQPLAGYIDIPFAGPYVTVSGLPAGYWWVDLRDSRGCTSMTDVDLQTQPCTFNASYNFCEVTLPTGGQSNGSFTVNVLDATGPFTVTVMDMSMNVIPGYENLQFATAPFTITGLPAGYYWVGITGASVNNGGKLCFGFVDVDLQTPRTTCNPVQICSYTQGFWGNTGGRNQTHLAKLNAMNLSGIPLVVGGTYTVTISSAASVIGALPGGGPSQALTVSGNLGSSPYNGKLKNTLLAQTITLGLNLRLPTGNLLSIVPLTGLVSQAVIDAVLAYGEPATVGGLNAFANYALGGGTDLEGVTLSNISDAVTAINEYFDECRMYSPSMPVVLASPRGAQPKDATAEVSDVTVAASPNPFQSNIRFVINSKVSGNAELGLYNLAGAKVAVPFSGHLSAGQTQTVDYTVPSTLRGGLMYMMKVGNKTTSGKLVSGSR